MAFNPFSTRPIGSPQYEDHIQDVYVSKYYQNMLPVDDSDISKLIPDDARLWIGEKEFDPWEDLMYAVTVQAVIDYIQFYRHWRSCQQGKNPQYEVVWHSRMLQLENDFFRRWDITEPVLDNLLQLLDEQYYHGDIVNHGAERIIAKIQRNYSKFCKDHDLTRGVIKK